MTAITGLDRGRRRVLRWLAGCLGLAAQPFRFARAAARTPEAAPVDVSLGALAPGDIRVVTWNGRPVFVRHRTGEEIARERAVAWRELRDPEPDRDRARRSEWVVVEGVCTHGGCTPTGPLGDYGGWYCLCHGSQFDTAGRVRAGPARENLAVPPYRFIDDRTLRIGQPPG